MAKTKLVHNTGAHCVNHPQLGKHTISNAGNNVVSLIRKP